MIEIDEKKYILCDSCQVHKNDKAIHQIAFGRDISRRGQNIWLCDICLNELKDKLNNMEVEK